MGGPDIPEAEGTEDALRAYINYYPQLVRTVRQSLDDVATSSAQAQAAAGQINAQSALDLLRNYGPAMAQAGANIEGQNMQQSLANELAALQGPGRQLVTEAQNIARAYDPEYFNTRQALAGQLTNMVSEFDPNRLSATEREEIARGLNRTNAARGLDVSPSMMNTIENAMTFGNALAQRRNQAMNMAQTGAQLLPTLRSNVDPFMIATRRPSNIGDQRLNTSNQQADTSQTWGMMNNLVTNGTSFRNNLLNAQTQASMANSPLALAQGWANIFF